MAQFDRTYNLGNDIIASRMNAIVDDEVAKLRATAYGKVEGFSRSKNEENSKTKKEEVL